MSERFEERLDAYAEVAVRIGLNLQPGQNLLLETGTEAAPMARLVAKHAYRAGAKFVEVLWDDPHVTRARYQHAPRDSFGLYPAWRAEAFRVAAERGDAILHLRNPAPDLLDDQDPERIGEAETAKRASLKPYAEAQGRHRVNWCIAAYPTQRWADKVFPEERTEDRLSLLWAAVFAGVRVDQPDPVVSWRQHLDRLDEVLEHLNARRYGALRYRGPGTELEIGLPAAHTWLSARFTREQGGSYIANLPTEEVFTSPHQDRTEGTVSASLPLSYAGGLIENFGLRFAGGRVVDAWAERGEELLRGILATDEGAGRLGEVALVPVDSPIAQSGRLFYNTLYDENAACHLALGRGFSFTLQGWQTMNDDALAAAGINRSLTHVDFMVGSEQLDIDGVTAGGGEESVMRSGSWAF